jgi:hypothetical protein
VTEATTDRGLRAVAFVTAAWAIVLAAICAVHNHRFLHDDAFITLRYARHVLDGYGPLWNKAGPRVEGFTSPLHMLLIAGLGALHIPLVTADRAINIAFHLLLVAGVWIFVRRSSGIVAGSLAAGMVLAYWPLIVWDFGGLDAVPFGALVTIGFLIGVRWLEGGTLRDLCIGGFVLGLAMDARPDAIVAVIVLFAATLFLGSTSFVERVRATGLGVLCCLAAALPWEIFRLVYFHQWLPNTYYAKVAGIPLGFRIHSGLRYWRASLHDPPFLLFLVVGTLLFAALRRRLTRADLAIYAYVAAYGLYIIVSGGDYMIALRFFTGLAPLMIVAFLRSAARLDLFDSPTPAMTASALLGIFTGLQYRRFELNPIYREPASLVGEIDGKQLAHRWPAGAVIGMNFTGSIPYFADDYTYIDMLGLNDVAIAHRSPMPVNGPWVHLIGHIKGDGKSVLDRNPDLLFLGGGVLYGDKYKPMLVGDWEMVHDPRFAHYKPCRIVITFPPAAVAQLHYGPTQMLFVYQRNDLNWPCDPPTARDWTQWSTIPHPDPTTSASPQGT